MTIMPLRHTYRCCKLPGNSLGKALMEQPYCQHNYSRNRQVMNGEIEIGEGVKVHETIIGEN